MKRRVAGVIMSVWAALGAPRWAGPAAAAAPAVPAAPVAATAAAAAPVDAHTLDYVARAVARVALVDLRVSQQLGVADYLAAAEILSIAHDLLPGDEEILRLLMEAELQSGRSDRLRALTRVLVGLAPADTVAQLSLITGRINQMQSADERLEALGTLLGPKGEGLDPSVRSRLALDAALLLRERGDAPGFTDRLREALRLDSTNRDAATLLVALVNGGGDTAAARLEALLVLLNADPIEQDTHQSIASELAEAGALKQALRFLESADALALAFTGDRSAAVAASRMLAQWRLLGPGKPLEFVEEQVLRRRREAQGYLDRAQAEGRDTSGMPRADAFRAPPQVERVWLMAAHDAGESTLRDLALAELDRTVAQAERNLADPERRAALGEETARTELETVQADGVWLRLLLGVQVERAEELLTALRANPRTGGPGLARLETWLALRKAAAADREAHELELQAQAPTDPLAALGVACALELRGEGAAAATRYAACASALSGTLEGAHAERRHLALTGRLPAPPPEAEELAAMAAGVPRWIDDMARDPRRFMQLTATPTAQTYAATERVGLTLRLRNVSPIALALGAEKTINSRFLLAPNVEVGSVPFRAGVPEFASLERRLRLAPREDLTVTLWPDSGYAPWFLELYAGELIRQRWRVVQGYRLTAAGVPDTGPMSLSTETAGIIRRPFTATKADVAEASSRLAGSSGSGLIDLLGSLRWRLFRDELTVKVLTPEEDAAARAGLLDRYTRGTAVERLLILAHLPPGSFIKKLAPFDLALAAVPESDERVGVFKVLTRGAQPGDAILTEALASPSARVRAAAKVAARRMVPNRVIYARAVSGAPPPQAEGGVETGAETVRDAQPEVPKPEVLPPATPSTPDPVPKGP